MALTLSFDLLPHDDMSLIVKECKFLADDAVDESSIYGLNIYCTPYRNASRYGS